MWDRWGEDWWEQRSFLERQRRRSEGVVFDEETNSEDIMTFSMMGVRAISPKDAQKLMVEQDEAPPHSGLSHKQDDAPPSRDAPPQPPV